MNEVVKASQITALFGRDLDDKDITQLFKMLNTIVLPTIRPEDYDDRCYIDFLKRIINNPDYKK